MQRYVRELAKDILKSVEGPANEYTDQEDRNESVQEIKNKVNGVLSACARGLITDREAVRELVS